MIAPSVLLLLYAAAPQQKPLEFSSTTEQVLVDVLALDASGKPVTDLRAEDFEVRDGGKARPVASFEAVRFEPGAAVAAGVAVDGFASNETVTAQGRVFVVVFDDNHLSPQTVANAKRAVPALLDALKPGDRVWLISTAEGAGYQAVVPGGAPGLLAALAKLQGRRPGDVSARHMSDYEAAMVMRRDPNVMRQLRKRMFDLEAETMPGKEVADVSGVGSQSVRAPVESEGLDVVSGKIQAEASQVDAAARVRRAATFAAVANAMDRLATVRGRKTFLLISEGFLDDLTTRGRPELLASAQRANAALYFVDARGLVAGPWTHEAEIARFADHREQFEVAEDVKRDAAGADSVALDTGGVTLHNTNDLASALGRVARESEAYYLIGYEPPTNLKPGAFRRIDVRVKRAGVELRSRRGYVVRDPRAATPASPLRSLAEAPFDAGGIPLRLATYVLGPADEGRTRVLIECELDPAGVGPQLEGLVSLDPGDGLPLWHEGPVPLRESVADPLGRSWAPFEHAVALGTGRYAVQVVVRDPASGRVGSVRSAFVVPEPGSLATTSPVLTDRLAEGEGGPRPVLLARRLFAPGARLYGMLGVLGAATGPAGPQVGVGYTLLAADGRTLATQPPTYVAPGPNGDVVALLSIPLGDAPPGRYELVLEVRDDITKARLGRSEAFVVGDPARPAAAP
jgi:VWFA-related protein